MFYFCIIFTRVQIQINKKQAKCQIIFSIRGFVSLLLFPYN
jgi:hypothetical protein